MNRGLLRMSIFAAMIALLFFSYSSAANLQREPDTRPGKGTEPEIVHELEGIKTSDHVRLGAQVTVCVKDLHQWINEGNDPNSLRLFLGGHMLPLTPPSGISPATQDYVNFVLAFDSRNREVRATWAEIFDTVRNADNRGISITVGDSSSRQAFKSAEFVVFDLYPWFTSLALLLVLLLLVALVLLAMHTNLLRDTAAGRPSYPAKAPLSLGRVQMAWWFYLVIASYVYIWLVTQVPDIPTGSVLGLLGISATTGLAAVAVDKNKISDMVNERFDLQTESVALQSRIGELKLAPDSSLDKELQAKKSRLAEVEARLVRIGPAPKPPSSYGVVDDLLSDGSGVSFHRFQIAVWTVVLGMVFIRAVYKDFAMPEFDPALLALMGVYSGTYVGFKFPEKPKAFAGVP